MIQQGVATTRILEEVQSRLRLKVGQGKLSSFALVSYRIRSSYEIFNGELALSFMIVCNTLYWAVQTDGLRRRNTTLGVFGPRLHASHVKRRPDGVLVFIFSLIMSLSWWSVLAANVCQFSSSFALKGM
jgi:hypothetical protein